MVSKDIHWRSQQVSTERLTKEVTDFMRAGSTHIVLLGATAWNGAGEDAAAILPEIVRVGLDIIGEVAVL